MNRVRQGLLALAGATLLAGCLPGAPPTTEELAERVHRDMRAIHEAAHAYKAEHGAFPEGNFWKVRSALVVGQYIKTYPIPPAAIFTDKPIDYRIDNYYDRMGGGPDNDTAIAVWGLRDDVCKTYNDLYASDRSGPTIYDWEGRGKLYPGATIGTHMQTYAIKWQSDAVDDCEIEWVVEYR